MKKTNISHIRRASVSRNSKSKLVNSLADKVHNLQRLSTSDVSDFAAIQRQVHKWKREKYNIKNSKNDIVILEKQIIRGQGIEPPEGKPKRNSEKTLDKLTIAFKAEHKNKGEGAHILKLPKLPYGQHTSYNDDSKFLQNHFIFDQLEATEEKIREIEDLNRKLRLYEKRIKGRGSLASENASRMHHTSNYDKYEMKAGILVCQKEHDVIKTYEHDKSKFIVNRKGIFQTFRELTSIDSFDTGLEHKLSKKQRKMSGDVKRRLYTHLSPEVSAKADSLLSKFGTLFETSSQEKQIYKTFSSS